MAPIKILMDSGFLYSLLYEKDARHILARNILEASKAEVIIPYVALTETAFLFNRVGGVPACPSFLGFSNPRTAFFRASVAP